jgi:N-methylhydantoinase B
VSTQDPFLVEVIKDALMSVGDEMFATLERTSMSPIIYEVLDFATGLTDGNGQLVTQGNGVAGFLGTLTTAVGSALEKFGDDLHPGDIIVTNDPYEGGGTHLSDVTLMLPIFIGGRLVAFAVSKAHWTEVGGAAPGSWSTDSTEVFQEGLQFPCIKIARDGILDPSLLDLIAANVRTPQMTLGDLHAQAAAMRVGERRLVEVCEKHGLEEVLGAMEHMLDQAERLTLAALEGLPRGVFEADDWIDDDGLGNGPFHVRVKVTVAADRLTVDFTGAPPQVPGPINNTWAGLLSGVRLLFKAITDPAIPVNEGCFRPLEVICPPGTLFTAERPAPTGTYWETLTAGADLVWKALAPHVPDRLPAGCLLSVCGTILSGTHPETGELFLLVEPQVGGWGAAAGRDGVQGNFGVMSGETYAIPVEVAETRYGVRVERFDFDPVDAGAGRRRGGRGVVREYLSLSDDVIVTATCGRHRFPPWGVAGGQDGSPNLIEVERADGTVERYGKTARLPLRRGDRVRVVTATGGGWGDPLERPVVDVIRDVRDGYVTVEQAAARYGVELDPESLDVVGVDPRRARALQPDQEDQRVRS